MSTETEQKKPVFELPFVFFMGPQRSGTSWLDRYLRARGDICLPSDVKEVFFFDRDFDKGVQSYLDHFSIEANNKLAMEISTTSFDNAEAPDRLFSVFGKDVKLVCPLRNPIVRSYSLYLHYLRYGIVTGSLQDACKQQPQIIESSYYTDNLERWGKHYDLGNIEFIFQEDLEADYDEYIRDICAILELPYIPLSDELKERYNVTTYSKFGPLAGFCQRIADWLRRNRLYLIVNFAKAIGLKRLIFGKENPDANKYDMPHGDYEFLFEKLGSETEKLEKLLNRDLSVWK